MADPAEAGPSSGAAPPAPEQPGPSKPGISNADEEDLLKSFFSDLREVDRDNEVNRILWAFKLNPFEKLNLRFDATPDEIRRQYRKTSLMVHPDKCKHPQAAAAFDVLGAAQKELLDDQKRESLLKVLDMAKEEVRKERKKQTKHDNLLRVASLLHEEGRDGIEAEWEKTDEFHEKWRLKAREFLANVEWRKRKLGKRLKEETARLDEEEAEVDRHNKEVKQSEKQWESTRESRVGTWQSFVKTKGGKKATGELKPPKQKTHDEDRLFVQRPVGEQFRPPPPGANPPKQ